MGVIVLIYCLQSAQLLTIYFLFQMQSMPNPEPGVVHLKTDTLQCRVFQNTTHLQSLHLKLAPLNEHDETSWSQEEFQVMEKFFEVKVVCPPFKPQALLAYARMLSVPYNVLKDFVQIMRLELVSLMWILAQA
jgi:mediator of RNA polymerase II transcription subunit 14